MENFVYVGLDLGWIVGLSSLAVALVLLVVFVVLHKTADKRAGYYNDGWAVAAGVLSVFTGILLVILVLCAVPFNAKYLGNYYVDGTVDEITNSFTDASGQLSANPVVDFSGIETPIEVSDARFLRLVGEDVTLKCSVIWHFRAADTYSCSLASIN